MLCQVKKQLQQQVLAKIFESFRCLLLALNCIWKQLSLPYKTLETSLTSSVIDTIFV